MADSIRSDGPSYLACSNEPYYHMVIDNFLHKDELEIAEKIYSQLEFKEKSTDLYRFLQSMELNGAPELDFLKKSLDTVFGKLVPLEGGHYSIFASYYRSGDHLLCHDDLIDERVYAFTFYLDDFESGDLVIYENDCVTENRRISIRKNRLVVFKVGTHSFHEVLECKRDGRKAFSGWLNFENAVAEHAYAKKSLFIPENVVYFDLGTALPEDNGSIICLEFDDINQKELRREKIGPYIDRRAVRIHTDAFYAPSFEGYCLVHAEAMVTGSNDYVLCNDIINQIEGDLMDVFIFKNAEEACKARIDEYIRYVDQKGHVQVSIDALPGHMLIVPRKDLSLCILRQNSTVFFRYMLYKRIA